MFGFKEVQLVACFVTCLILFIVALPFCLFLGIFYYPFITGWYAFLKEMFIEFREAFLYGGD